MSVIHTIGSTLKNPLLWQSALGISAFAAATALLIVGIQGVHFNPLHIHLPFYNTYALFDLTKTAALLGGSGVLMGLGVFVLKRVTLDRFISKAEKKENPNLIERAVKNSRLMGRLFAVAGIFLGIAAVAGSIFYIAQFLPHQLALHGGSGYLANEALLKALLASMTIGTFLVTIGLLSIARYLSSRPKSFFL